MSRNFPRNAYFISIKFSTYGDSLAPPSDKVHTSMETCLVLYEDRHYRIQRKQAHLQVYQLYLHWKYFQWFWWNRFPNWNTFQSKHQAWLWVDDLTISDFLLQQELHCISPKWEQGHMKINFRIFTILSNLLKVTDGVSITNSW